MTTGKLNFGNSDRAALILGGPPSAWRFKLRRTIPTSLEDLMVGDYIEEDEGARASPASPSPDSGLQ